MEIHRDVDIQAITDNLDLIMDEANKKADSCIEPTLEEYHTVMGVIFDFIKKKRRVIHGGFTYNVLLKAKDKSLANYKHTDRKDVDFYTPEPKADLVELVNLLDDKGYKYVNGHGALHEDTFKINVNFQHMCDLTYMPKNIFHNLQVIEHEGVLHAHPKHLMIDIIREYNDPINSYWRLRDKTFFKANKLLKYYPLKWDTSKPFQANTNEMEAKQKAFDVLKEFEGLFMGSIPRTYYLTRKKELDLSGMVFVPRNNNTRKIAKDIYDNIKAVLNKELNVIGYRPLYHYWDERYDFIINDTVIVTIRGNYNMCIPYNTMYVTNNKAEKVQTGGFYKNLAGGKAEQPIMIATFMGTILHNMVAAYNCYTSRSDKYKQYEHVLHSLITERNKYLTKENKTVLDNTPYREFIIRCVGKMYNYVREASVIREKKRAKHIYTFRYSASDRGKTPDTENKFKNTSGNKINENIINLFKGVPPTTNDDATESDDESLQQE